jgi:hypothetical protein
MKTVRLSELDPNWDCDEVVNYMLDNGYDIVENDTIGPPHVEYEYSDMYEYWEGLKNFINGRYGIFGNGTRG